LLMGSKFDLRSKLRKDFLGKCLTAKKLQHTVKERVFNRPSFQMRHH